MNETISGWDNFELEDRGISHTVFVKGSGRGVVLVHELPGMTRQCVNLGERLVGAGYRVFMPLLFGRPNEDATFRNTIRVCISREFSVFQSEKTSPIVEWLRALCRKALGECAGQGVGVIGMCLTGNFAITLVAEPAVLAPVICQPSLPFSVFGGTADKLAMLPADLEAAKTRARDLNVPLLGFRFQGDTICKAEKFQRLRAEFGDRFRGTELPGTQHSVLTGDFVDQAGHPTKQALETTLAFLRERLGG